MSDGVTVLRLRSEGSRSSQLGMAESEICLSAARFSAAGSPKSASQWVGRQDRERPPPSRHPCKLTFEVFTNVIQLMFVLTSLRGAENSLFYSKHGLVVFFTD